MSEDISEKQEKTTVVDAPAETTPATGEAITAAPKTKRKKNKRTVTYGQLHIQATFNNTIISITDQTGGLLAQSSAGACGFRGSKKGTAYAAQIAAEKVCNVAKQQHGLLKVDVYVKGIGQGRDMAIRALSGVDIAVESIKDVTPVKHGGTRPRKARRN
jgi:small subunit ribosomal protein S11